MGRDSDTGGQVRYVLELARTLAEFEAVEQVDLFTRQVKDKRVSEDYAQAVEVLGPKCRLVRLPCGGGKYLRKEKLWPHLDEFSDAMIAFTRREGRVPAVVHGHYADAGYVAREVAKAFDAPFVFTGHSLGRDKLAYLREEGMNPEAINRDFNMDRRIAAEEASLAAADLVVVSTRHERDSQYARYENGKTPRFEVLPPGTDLSRFFPYYDYDIPGAGIEESFKQARMRMLHELNRFHFQTEKPLVLALCRPDKRKNITALIEAYGEDKELQAMANLAVFAGIRSDISDMPEAEQQVLTDILLLMDRYDLYGKMAIPKRHHSETDVPELYRIAASKRGVFVNAAFVEPFGLTFIESSATGLPFVGTHNGGPQDIVENCASGLLVNVESRDEIRAAIKRLLSDQALWETCSTNGINRVREHYTWRHHCERYLDGLTSLGTGPSRAQQLRPRPQVPTAKRLGALPYLLITDIDNTLLGEDDSLARLRELLAQHHGRIGFGVATGRYLESAREVLQAHDFDDVDVMITSVGTEIYYGANLEPDKGWASQLRAKWRPDRVRAVLDALPCLRPQADPDTQREFKVSYDLSGSLPPDAALEEVHGALRNAGLSYNLVFSHGVYVDLLAPRASKGKAIRYLADKWNIPPAHIVTAGDSGNDRDMLAGPSCGIVVGNHDPELEALRRSGSRIYFASARCAAGIIEGLEHYGLL
jgi:sucrose-phosphate synthase